MKLRRGLLVRGLVQGIGFRPAVANRARCLGLTGLVRNTLQGAWIEVQGGEGAVGSFIDEFPSSLPRGALVEGVESSELPLEAGEGEFQIVESSRDGPSRFSIPPDLALCPECRAEFSDPRVRRYQYPFVSCGSCGPRYSYMRGLPYDRANTAMSSFPLCPACRAEYEDPRDRRYHIEGFCCPDCGPALSGLEEGVAALLAGGIAAIKGIGGYHLACLADDAAAIEGLRLAKRRPTKPLAAMYPSLAALESAALLLPEEGAALLSPEAPIVLIPKACFKAPPLPGLAPGNPSLGVLLPYSPVHELILMRIGRPLALTSANLPGDPLVIDDERAREGFAGLVDAIVSHDRAILQRADDGVLFFAKGLPLRVRNGRGSAPRPIRLASPSKRAVLALGAELKSTVTVVSGSDLATSPHIGDLESLPAFEHFGRTVEGMLAYYGVEPDCVAVDLHPDYESTRLGKRLARDRGIELVEVQHHYAHFLSVLLDAGRLEEGRGFLGIVLDGSGYGTDGTLWGGELLFGDAMSYQRLASLALMPLPGGEAAVREPWRMAAGLGLGEAGWWGREGEELDLVRRLASDRALSPLTSSCGRLFDAAAAILGYAGKASFEGEAAIWLEGLAAEAGSTPRYATQLAGFEPLDGPSLLGRLAERVGDPRSLDAPRRAALARAFHLALAATLLDEVAGHADRLGVGRDGGAASEVVLAGGVFQNRILLELVLEGLARRGLRPLVGGRLPLNDGGISAGQAAFAAMAGRGTIRA